MFLCLHSLRYKEGSELNRVDIDAAGDGVNTLHSGYFLAFATHRPTLVETPFVRASFWQIP